MATIKLSIIVPTYNAAATIEACVESVLQQTFQDYELLVMDGKSADNTLENLSKYISNKKLQVFSEKDKGVYDAMNKGLHQAKGVWLYFLGADDILHDKDVLKDIFSKQIEGYDLIYGKVLFKKNRNVYHEQFSRIDILDKNISHQSAFYSKSLLLQLEGYNLKYPILADYDVNLKIFGRYYNNVLYINRLIAVYNDMQGLSNTLRDKNFKKDRAAIVRVHFPFLYYVYAAVVVPIKHFKLKRYIKW